MNPAKHKIVIIGCGNVAWHLAKHLAALKKYSIFVYNHARNTSLEAFETKLKCKTNASLETILPDADFYFICVSDKHIPEVSKKINDVNMGAIIVHCSGSLPVDAIKTSVKNKAVFYPLQTFSKNSTINWSEVPILIESNNAGVAKKMQAFANQFTQTVLSVDYKTRIKLHLAAVLVNNFTNALYVAASDLISGNEGNTNFDILLPLIKQTTQKVENINPRLAQTGPAKRKDEAVLERHLKLLSAQPELKKIYKQLSKLIVKQQKN
jgi:predicted short-subunit dehydrogenase-like oxidoreductase (DUF2520 family)